MQWETVIGLEVHTQLTTQSKIFSGASIAFGAEPNTQACQVDIALPGVLPVLNKGAVECGHPLRPGHRRQAEPDQQSSTARITSTPTCPRATRSASLSCPSSRAAS
jgi:aspartyl-tRNA(Asn)/glutamyl-tRNA(Gln) amidotransferase subunit B